MRQLKVYINRQQVGALSETENLWRFDYDTAWAASAEGFDLSPALSRSRLDHVDGATVRPVQWYFDNLLPEQELRKSEARQAGLDAADAFALLEYLGAESAGSLTLLPDGQEPQGVATLAPLTDTELTRRIKAMPQATLTKGSPKRMSLAGAQHKLLVVYGPADDALFEPEGATPSTYILKPDHPNPDAYAHSVINEFFTMKLARAMGLDVPPVYRRYTPLPVYLVQRFDRQVPADGSETQRLHIIDACQLLNVSFTYKMEGNLDTMTRIIAACRQTMVTRQRLFSWLVFNLLVGNDDNHLKNLSFTVQPGGVDLAPHYDLLATAVYYTKAMAGENYQWPYPQLAIKIPGANSFHTVTRASVLAAGRGMGLPARQVERIVDGMASTIEAAAGELIADIEEQNAALAADPQIKLNLGGETRLLRSIQKIIISEMAGRIGPQSGH